MDAALALARRLDLARDLRSRSVFRFGPRRLAEETPLSERILVCGESVARVVDGVAILPVMEFLRRLWGGELLVDSG